MLTFDAAEHRYYWNGEEIPGVTSILKQRRLTPPYPDTPSAAEKRDAGTDAHAVLADYDIGFASEQDVIALGNPGVQYLQFLRDFGMLPRNQNNYWTVVESPVCCEECWYAGTMDRGGIARGGLIVLDLKRTSGSPPPCTALQTIAYGYAWMRQQVLDSAGYALRLPPEGRYKLVKYWETRAEASALLVEWFAALSNYHWDRKTWKKKGMTPPCLLNLPF